MTMASSAATSLLCSRSLTSLLNACAYQIGHFQCQALSAFSAQAAANVNVRNSEPASTSGRSSAGSVAGRPRGGKANAAPDRPASAAPNPGSSPGADAATAAAAAAAAVSHVAPSRLAQYARTILHRELMLKLSPRSWKEVPRLVSVEASIRSSDTKLERDTVDKWELLLHSLALETLTARPAEFISPANKHVATRAAGVTVKLDAVKDADAAYGFLEKLVHVILPNQVGFEGVAPPTPVEPKYRSPKEAYIAARRAARDHRLAPLKPFAANLRVVNLLPYPDFEQNFAMFEPLSGMRVQLVVEGTCAEDCAALLTGLSVPVLTGAAAEAALEAAKAEALAEMRKNRS